jgi:chemotaxis response regulator CheB
VVFGMPKKAIELGAVNRVAHLKNIPGLVLSAYAHDQVASASE